MATSNGAFPSFMAAITRWEGFGLALPPPLKYADDKDCGPPP